MHDRITLTREELFDLVWTKPMSRLAAEYSMSNVGLAKLCARHDIPTPPRGYWAKLKAGEAPTRPKLPPSKNCSPIELRATTPEESAGSKDELALAIEDERKPENSIVVAERLQSPCALVREAKAALQDAAPDHLGILKLPARCLDLRVSRAQLPRALRIVDALIGRFTSRGWEVVIQEGATVVHVDQALVTIAIEEALATVEVPAKRDLSGSYSFHYSRYETVRKPAGRLSVAILEREHLWDHAQQRNWHDSENRALEEHLNDVIVGVLKLAAAIRAARARKEQEAREVAERQRKLQAALDEQRRLRAALAHEKACVAYLLDQATRWRRSQDLRAFIAQAREQGGVPELQLEGQAHADWVEWAMQQADRLDPFAPSPPSILDEAEKIEHMCDHLRAHP
jgi:hypothetical protein